MSLAARQKLVTELVFDPSKEVAQRNDFLRIPPSQTSKFAGMQTQAVAHHQWMCDRGHIIGITVAQTGHHDDGVNGHAGGKAADGWPLRSRKWGDWVDASDPEFQRFLKDLRLSPYWGQTGLVGDGADSRANFIAAGAPNPNVFQDTGGPHVHMGAKFS